MGTPDETSDRTPARVLIAEDNPQVRDLYRERIVRAGPYTVSVAADGVEALERIESEGFDLAFVDLDLPHVHGSEVVERAHDADPELPIVVVTGHDQTGEADIPSVAALLVKPVGSGTLADLAERILESETRAVDA